jgi:hypothetical protein
LYVDVRPRTRNPTLPRLLERVGVRKNNNSLSRKKRQAAIVYSKIFINLRAGVRVVERERERERVTKFPELPNIVR